MDCGFHVPSLLTCAQLTICTAIKSRGESDVMGLQWYAGGRRCSPEPRLPPLEAP